jgi:hypothetical protein
MGHRISALLYFLPDAFVLSAKNRTISTLCVESFFKCGKVKGELQQVFAVDPYATGSYLDPGGVEHEALRFCLCGITVTFISPSWK